MKVVGIAGKKYSGKTRAAGFFIDACKELGVDFKKESFKESILKNFAEEKNLSFSMLLSEFAKEEYLPIIQNYITEKNLLDRFFFTRNFFNGIHISESIVIDDVSTIVELEAIYRYGGSVYKIESCGKIIQSRREYIEELHNEMVSEGMEGYLSIKDCVLYEDELGPVDPHCLAPYGGYIYNNKDIDSLEAEVKKIARRIVTSSILS